MPGRGNFERHRQLAKFTFPIWLYVAVTGVIVYHDQSLLRMMKRLVSILVVLSLFAFSGSTVRHVSGYIGK